MDYSFFESLITEETLPTTSQLVVFSALPIYQKIQLLKTACAKESLTLAKLLMSKISLGDKSFIQDILSQLICEQPQKEIDTIAWLYSLQPPNLEQNYKQMLKIQPLHIIEFIFSRYPINSKKLYYMITYCIHENLKEPLNWIIEQQKLGFLPYSEDMYYWAIYSSYKKAELSSYKEKDLLSHFLINRMIVDFPLTLIHIKTKLIQSNYQLPDISLSIINTDKFCIYFNNLTCKFFANHLSDKLNNNNNNKPQSVKRSKI
jgi:hypothetical protein